jgi:dipeptidyl aminopeptidase/acylaminoacyl peptidase
MICRQQPRLGAVWRCRPFLVNVAPYLVADSMMVMQFKLDPITMPSLARHTFGWYYIYLRLAAGLLRSLAHLTRSWLLGKPRVHEGVLFRSITVPSRDKGRNIKVHLYQPAGYDSTKPVPVLVNLHGSVKLP